MEKGKDVLPIWIAFEQFGSKWYAEQVFSDSMPRALKDVFDESCIQKIMRNLITREQDWQIFKIPIETTRKVTPLTRLFEVGIAKDRFDAMGVSDAHVRCVQSLLIIRSYRRNVCIMYQRSFFWNTRFQWADCNILRTCRLICTYFPTHSLWGRHHLRWPLWADHTADIDYLPLW